MGYHYLSPTTVRSQRRLKKGLIIAGAIVAGINAFGAITGIVDPEGGTAKHVPVYLIMLIPGIVLLLWGLWVGKQIHAAIRYETIFSGDKNGIVEIRELTEQTACPPEKIMKELEVLFRKGYFMGCSLRREGSPAVVINDAQVGEAGAGFAEVRCPKCGGTTRIRAGSRGQCSFCHGPIADQSMGIIK